MPAPDLTELAAKVNAALRSARRSPAQRLRHYRRIRVLLLEAKAAPQEHYGHGSWLVWVRAHLACSDRQARRFMHFVRTDAADRRGDEAAAAAPAL